LYHVKKVSSGGGGGFTSRGSKGGSLPIKKKGERVVEWGGEKRKTGGRARIERGEEFCQAIGRKEGAPILRTREDVENWKTIGLQAMPPNAELKRWKTPKNDQGKTASSLTIGAKIFRTLKKRGGKPSLEGRRRSPVTTGPKNSLRSIHVGKKKKIEAFVLLSHEKGGGEKKKGPCRLRLLKKCFSWDTGVERKRGLLLFFKGGKKKERRKKESSTTPMCGKKPPFVAKKKRKWARSVVPQKRTRKGVINMRA